MKFYNEGDSPDTATEKCVAEKWDTSVWIGRQNKNTREYTMVDTCPCEPLKPQATFNLFFEEPTTVDQKIAVEFYQPCTDQWIRKSIEASTGDKNMRLVIGKKFMGYYPSKV